MSSPCLLRHNASKKRCKFYGDLATNLPCTTGIASAVCRLAMNLWRNYDMRWMRDWGRWSWIKGFIRIWPSSWSCKECWDSWKGMSTSSSRRSTLVWLRHFSLIASEASVRYWSMRPAGRWSLNWRCLSTISRRRTRISLVVFFWGAVMESLFVIIRWIRGLGCCLNSCCLPFGLCYSQRRRPISP